MALGWNVAEVRSYHYPSNDLQFGLSALLPRRLPSILQLLLVSLRRWFLTQRSCLSLILTFLSQITLNISQYTLVLGVWVGCKARISHQNFPKLIWVDTLVVSPFPVLLSGCELCSVWLKILTRQQLEGVSVAPAQRNALVKSVRPVTVLFSSGLRWHLGTLYPFALGYCGFTNTLYNWEILNIILWIVPCMLWLAMIIVEGSFS